MRTIRQIPALALATLLGLLALAPAVLAQPGPRGDHHRGGGPGFHSGGGHHGGGILHGLRGLDLTDTQKEEIRSILEASREDNADTRQALHEARKALHEAVRVTPFDEAGVRIAAAALADLEADQAVERARTFNAVYDVLTPEQRTELAELRAEADERRQERRERFRERRRERNGATG
jgi:periplasmic protein CpxP/Spy